MLYLSSDLQAKGFSLFLDKEQRIEITSTTDMPVVAGGELEFYLGLNSFTTNHTRFGNIIVLEEEYRVLLFDIVNDIQGNFFRRYDEIESIEIETTFDSLGFFMNVLKTMMHVPLYSILEFISKSHISKEDAFRCTWCVDSKVVIFDGRCPKIEEDSYPVWAPSGFWGDDEWPSKEVYNFYLDFFNESGSSKKSLFEQYRNNSEVRNKIRYNFTKSGFSTDGVNYNYVNNIRPEIIELLDIRWKNGTFEIEDGELREVSENIMSRFQSWYTEHEQLLVNAANCDTLKEGIILFKADWPTVLHHTKLGKVSQFRQYSVDRGTLVSLLGLTNIPGLCIEEFGTTIDNPDFMGPILPENGFMVVKSELMEDMGYTMVISDEYGEKCDNLVDFPTEMNYVKAFYSIYFSNGIVGGKKVFDAGTGTEFRYFIPFGTFLSEQGWTLEDFYEIYKTSIDARCVDLEDAVVEPKTNIKPSMYSEFNSKYEKAPFDDIRYYVPVPFSLGGSTKVSKRIVSVNQEGNIITEFSSSEVIAPGDFTASINKDEYVSSAEVTNSIRVFMSEYMQTRIKIKVKENTVSINDLRVRISASDMTFIQKRNFKHA